MVNNVNNLAHVFFSLVATMGVAARSLRLREPRFYA
jgi:hypothetical protein